MAVIRHTDEPIGTVVGASFCVFGRVCSGGGGYADLWCLLWLLLLLLLMMIG